MVSICNILTFYIHTHIHMHVWICIYCIKVIQTKFTQSGNSKKKRKAEILYLKLDIAYQHAHTYGIVQNGSKYKKHTHYYTYNEEEKKKTTPFGLVILL